ncbi:hypothetical protein PROFUN_14602, partial [Planoprotostelium fungivorum]
LIQNNATGSGGAVYVISGGGVSNKRTNTATMNLYGEKFRGNVAGNLGGAMSVGGGATVKMNEGSMSGNTAAEGGDSVVTSSSGSLQLSGVENSGTVLIESSSTLIVNDGTTGADVRCNTGEAQKSSDGSYSCVVHPTKNTGLIVGLTLGLLFLVTLVTVVTLFVWRNTVNQRREEEQSILALTSALGRDREGVIDYEELKNVTETPLTKRGGVMVAEWRAIRVSVKQIDGRFGFEELSAFLKQVAVLRDMKRHPNVVLFLGITVPPQILSIITEFADGGNLRDLLRDDREIDYKIKLQYMAQIALGMNHLHSEGIVHKELSAENILITKSTVKISGFGLSQLKPKNKMERLKTSAKYMAPECISSEISNRETDVYSFSILAWEILHGTEPYAFSSPIEIAVSVSQGGRPPVDDSLLGMLLADCWADSPNVRPTFNDICVALERMGTISREERDDDVEMMTPERGHYSGIRYNSSFRTKSVIVETPYQEES